MGRRVFVWVVCSLAVACDAGSVTTEHAALSLESVVDLIPGDVLADLSGPQDSWQTYRLVTPPGTEVIGLELFGGTGDADLFLKRGAPPAGEDDYDYGLGRAGNSEGVHLAVDGGDDWYIGVFGYADFEGASLWADYSTWLSTQNLHSGFYEYDLSGTDSSWRYYRIQVPGNASELRVETRGGVGDTNIFIDRFFEPTSSLYDRRTYGLGTWKTLTLYDPAPGRYYIGLRGEYEGYLETRLRATVR